MTERHLDMPDRVYRKAEGISTSSLRLLRKSPAHFLSARERPPSPTEAMIFGTALHEFLLGGHEADSRLIVRPDLQSAYTKEGKAWKSSQIQLGKVIVSEEQMENITLMRDTLLLNPEIASVLSGRREVSMFMDEEYGMHQYILKGRSDLAPLNTPALWDIKTCGDASNFQKLKWKIIDYGYDLQAYIYLRLFNATRPPDEPPKDRFIFIFVETERPFAFRKIELDSDWLARAEQDYHWLIGLYLSCRHTGHWPGYEDRVHTLSYPAYRNNGEEE